MKHCRVLRGGRHPRSFYTLKFPTRHGRPSAQPRGNLKVPILAKDKTLPPRFPLTYTIDTPYPTRPHVAEICKREFRGHTRDSVCNGPASRRSVAQIIHGGRRHLFQRRAPFDPPEPVGRTVGRQDGQTVGHSDGPKAVGRRQPSSNAIHMHQNQNSKSR